MDTGMVRIDVLRIMHHHAHDSLCPWKGALEDFWQSLNMKLPNQVYVALVQLLKRLLPVRSYHIVSVGCFVVLMNFGRSWLTANAQFWTMNLCSGRSGSIWVMGRGRWTIFCQILNIGIPSVAKAIR